MRGTRLLQARGSNAMGVGGCDDLPEASTKGIEKKTAER